jgi:hypothetical protein
MGIWKVGYNVRLAPESRASLEEFAKRESRTFSNLCGILLEWGLAKLREAGSTEQLLHRKVPIPRNPDGKYKRKTTDEPRPEQGGKALCP